ncbi:hypothetical protein MTR_0496s0030 [Medicago truncatula]|uniref:Uncharacterized protein n=1 Tax=Medicago truncatula TaxID=3880 RepID=A0A072TE92_MEDTR|nr:hypothetical protein MTR_0496s0030 [Medicago truncatula]
MRILKLYSRFQTLQSGLQVLKKSYTVSDHANTIHRSLLAIFRPKIELVGDKSAEKFKSIALIAKDKSAKMEKRWYIRPKDFSTKPKERSFLVEAVVQKVQASRVKRNIDLPWSLGR